MPSAEGASSPRVSKKVAYTLSSHSGKGTIFSFLSSSVVFNLDLA